MTMTDTTPTDAELGDAEMTADIGDLNYRIAELVYDALIDFNADPEAAEEYGKSIQWRIDEWTDTLLAERERMAGELTTMRQVAEAWRATAYSAVSGPKPHAIPIRIEDIDAGLAHYAALSGRTAEDDRG